MSQTIKLKRGLEANRGSITPLAGELIYTTDNLEVFFGDGTTLGGSEIGYLNTRTGGSVNGLVSVVSGTTTALGDANSNVFEVVDSDGAALFEVTETGNAIIAGVLTVNGDGTSVFNGNVSVGGSLSVSGDATVAVDLSADTLTLTGDLNVNGNTYLGNEPTDTISLTGKVVTDILPSVDNTYDIGSPSLSWAELHAGNIASTTDLTTVTSPVTIANGDQNLNVFEVVGAEGAKLFEVTQTGDAIIAGVLTVNGDGQSSFSGDVLIGGSLQVNGDATVAVDLAADTLTLTGDLQVNGNTTLGNEPTDTTTINGSTTINGTTNIVGDLIVTGTTTTVNSNEVNIGDSIILLNSDETGLATQDGGIEIERGTLNNVSLYWDETQDQWMVTKVDGTDTQSSVRLLDTDDLTNIQNTIGAQALDDLSDVTITSVATSDMIMFNGTEWVNSNTIDGGTF